MVKVELMHFAEPWMRLKQNFQELCPCIVDLRANIMIMKEKVIRAPSDLKGLKIRVAGATQAKLQRL